MRPAFRTLGCAAILLACLPLQACGKYGPHGDRGLPPAPADMAFPNINRNATAPEPGRRVKSQAEQQRLKADILARKPAPR